MRIVIFCHSLISDWNNGNAHFLRGVASELIALGHQVDVYEPYDAWSAINLLREEGSGAVESFGHTYPAVHSFRYDPDRFDLEAELRDASLVLVHEWNDAALVNGIARLRRQLPFVALFHDTHHRAVSSPGAIPFHDLEGFDGVLAFGRSLADAYNSSGFGKPIHIWHEAADTKVFYPRNAAVARDDLVWIGNWGDDERTEELTKYLLQPVSMLRLRTSVYGVRYPAEAREHLRTAGIDYKGWIANVDVPRTFGLYKFTVHIPRRWYADSLPGIPTIRVFEALACEIPLICAPWEDTENLFQPGDFLMARDGDDMAATMLQLLAHPREAAAMAARGRRTILAGHTCAHRAAHLMAIVRDLGSGRSLAAS